MKFFCNVFSHVRVFPLSPGEQLIFSTLEEAGVLAEGNQEIYRCALQIPERSNKKKASLEQYKARADALRFTLETLKCLNITPANSSYTYQASIRKTYTETNDFKQLITMLQKEGMTPEAHGYVYLRAIDTTASVKTMHAVLDTLRKAGMTPEKNHAIYSQVIYRIESYSRIKNLITLLASENIQPTVYEVIYLDVITKLPSDDRLKSLIQALKSHEIDPEKHAKIYMAAVSMMYYSENVIALISALKTHQVAPERHQKIYLAAIKRAMVYEAVIGLLETLRTFQFTLEKHGDVYFYAIEGNFTKDAIKALIQRLKAFDIKAPENLEIYAEVMKRPSYQKEMLHVFDYLKKQNVLFSEHPSCYFVACQNVHHGFLLSLEKMNFDSSKRGDLIEVFIKTSAYNTRLTNYLKSKNLMPDSHLAIYESLFSHLNLLQSPYYQTKLITQLDNYFKETPYPEYQKLCDDIESMLKSLMHEEDIITSGPLNKSDATHFFEDLLQRIVETDLEAIQMAFDASVGYSIQLGSAPKIYVSEVLRFVNFTHIDLTEKVSGLTEKLEKIDSSFKTHERHAPEHLVIGELPAAAQRVLAIYSWADTYRAINEIFRGIEFTPTGRSNEALYLFLCACLINWSAEELTRILVCLDERIILEKVLRSLPGEAKDFRNFSAMTYQKTIEQAKCRDIITEAEYQKVKSCFEQLDILFPHYALLDRKETFQSDPIKKHLEVEKQRLANPTYTMAVTSMSALPSGAPNFSQYTHTTKFETSHDTRPMVNPSEGEILVPHGSTYVYTGKPDIAREVRSPGVMPWGDYWSSMALAFLYEKYLSKPTSYKKNRIKVDQRMVQRPHDGLAHRYRMMIYVDVLLDYFARHVRELQFKAFCRDITLEERAALRVAALFSYTDSEQDSGARQKHLKDFLDAYPPFSIDKSIQEEMLNIIDWKDNLNPKAAASVGFIKHILSLAHALDSVRNCSPDVVHDAMGAARSLIAQSSAQVSAYRGMIAYAVALTGAHGDSLKTKVSSDGQLQEANDTYHSPFGLVSTSLRHLHEITNTIKRPQLTEIYQFTAFKAQKNDVRLADEEEQERSIILKQ